jgi:predicted nuclease with TOPRIM domain
VVQLSKEALQAIEQAGNECGVGKRGGPRLNYDDLDPKRRKFLERNRQAAARCRERKKQWIVSLEGRSNELKDDNRRVEEDVIRLKTKVDQLRKVLTQQDRNIQSTHQRTQVVGQVQQEVQMETEMNTDSGVETAESLPTGEIIMAKTEMEAER